MKRTLEEREKLFNDHIKIAYKALNHVFLPYKQSLYMQDDLKQDVSLYVWELTKTWKKESGCSFGTFVYHNARHVAVDRILKFLGAWDREKGKRTHRKYLNTFIYTEDFHRNESDVENEAIAKIQMEEYMSFLEEKIDEYVNALSRRDEENARSIAKILREHYTSSMGKNTFPLAKESLEMGKCRAYIYTHKKKFEAKYKKELQDKYNNIFGEFYE